MKEPKVEKLELTKEELVTLINIVGQVSVPIASKEANVLRELINKMSKMIDQIK